MMYIKNMRESLSRLPVRVFVLFALLVTVWLWGWFFIQGITYLDQWHLSLRDALITGVSLLILQIAVKQPLYSCLWRGAWPPFMAWILIFSFVIGQGHGNQVADYRLINPYLLGGSALLWIQVLLIYWGTRCGKKTVVVCAAVSLILAVFQLISSVTFLAYYLIYQKIFAPADFLPVVQTHWSEIVGFISSPLIWKPALGGLIALLLILIPEVVLLVRAYQQRDKKIFCVGQGYKVIQCLLFLMALLLVKRWIPECYPVFHYRVSKQYIESVRKAEEFHRKNVASLILMRGSDKALPSEVPGTVILIIGESENRDMMKAFTPDYPVDTTPWLSRKKESPSFFLYPHAYTNFPATTGALTMALTGMNQYNHKSVEQVVNLMDIAKAAGYDTWWISNHQQMNTHESGVELVSEAADHQIWENPPEGADECMLKELRKVPRSGNHFIVLHIMGSHNKYISRIPPDFKKIKVPGRNATENAYANTVLYTDQILEQIFDYAQNNLHLAAMVYSSDHGEDMVYQHGSGRATWPMMHIPFFIYLSPEYMRAYPEIGQTLKVHQNRVFTNDMLFDTMSGILQAPNNNYSEAYDLTSSGYNIDKNNALTVWGEKKIKDDPEIN